MENNLVRNSSRNVRVYVNRDIRFSQVRCIDKDNENIGVINTSEALSLAIKSGLDLVQVSPFRKGDIPTCKIIDHGKYKYEMSKKDKERRKKQRESTIKVKEIKFRPNTELNDLKTKAAQASKFIADGCRVKVVVTFKGREMSHKNVAHNRLGAFLDFIDGDVFIVNEPQMDGRFLFTVIGGKLQPNERMEKVS